MKMEIYCTDFACFEQELLENGAFMQRAMENLSGERQEKIRRFRHGRARLQSLAAGLLLDFGLRRYGLSEREAQFSYGANGKPALLGHTGPHFNLSHSGTMALAVFSDHEVGCDIQQVAEAPPRVAERFFTKGESAYLESLGDGPGQGEAFFGIWTLKESYLKASGTGMASALDSFSVLPGERPGGYAFREYVLPAYRAAVCAAVGGGDADSMGAEFPELVTVQIPELLPELTFCPFQNFPDVV